MIELGLSTKGRLVKLALLSHPANAAANIAICSDIGCDTLNRHFFHGPISQLSFFCHPDCLMGGGKLTGHLRFVHVLAGPAFRPFRIPLVIPLPALPGLHASWTTPTRPCRPG